MGNLALVPQIRDADGGFRKTYPWLKSAWPDLRWSVVDPISIENPKKTDIVFDGVLAPRLQFSHRPTIIEDLKYSLVMSVELSQLSISTGGKVGSHTAMRHHINCLQRIYREIFAMGCENLSDLTVEELSILKKRLSTPEYVSLKYPDRLAVFFERCELESLSVKVDESRKNPSTVDMDWLYAEIGISPYVVRLCQKSRRIISEINGRLSALYPEYRWEANDDRISQPLAAGRAFVNEKHLSVHFQALERYYLQSNLLRAFQDPLKLNPIIVSPAVDAAELIANASSTRGRTRNIPANQFLTVMDRAVRWVVDYAEPLFALEEQAAPVYQNYLEQYGSHEAGKLLNGWIRRAPRNLETGAKASPFPLAGYKVGSKKPPIAAKYDDELLLAIQTRLEGGVKSGDVMSEFGLLESQLAGIKARIKDVRYSRNIRNTGISLNDALYSFLPLSCALILLTFTAGRESSVYGLKAGCVHRVLGSRFIRMYVQKTLRKDEDFPTVAIVEKAVQVLERLSQRARNANSDESLFQFCDLINREKPKEFRFDDVINRFLDFIGMPAVQNGDYFKFSEHQFRRFFCIMYFYRYEDGDFEALAYHLRHSDWSMTERYLSEKEYGQIFKEIEQERIASLALRAGDGDRVSGAMAEELKRSIVQTVRMESENRFEMALKQVKKNSLVIDFIPGGLCFGRSPGRIERSNCLLMEGGEAHVMTHRASEVVCKGCPNHLLCEEMGAAGKAQEGFEGPFRCNSSILDGLIAQGGVHEW